MAGPGFEVLTMITIRMKVRTGLPDTLRHAVGETAGEPEGAPWHHRSRIQMLLCELAGAPLLVASSSRPPAVPSGGQEQWDLSHVENRGFGPRGRKMDTHQDSPMSPIGGLGSRNRKDSADAIGDES